MVNGDTGFPGEIREDELIHLISYPANGKKRSVTNATDAILKINFKNGEVKLPNGTGERLSNALDDFPNIRFIRSFTIFSTDNFNVKVGNAVFFSDQCTWLRLQNINVTEIEIQWLFTNTPDTQEFLIVASNSRMINFDPSVQTTHSTSITSLTTNDANQNLFEKHTIAFRRQFFKIRNTDASNDTDVDIQYKEVSGGTYLSEVGFPKLVAAGDQLVLSLKDSHHFVRVLVKNTVAGNNATLSGEWFAQS